MHTTLTRLSPLLLLSSFLLSTACNDGGGDPTAVWDDERVRSQGTLTVSPSSFQVREGESVTLHARYQGTADFSPSRVNWTVRPVGAGRVENGVFTAEVAGPVTVEGRFSSLADTAEATIRPELIDFVRLSAESMTASAGEVVPDSVSVKVLGRQNAPVPDEVVEFEVVDGQGNVSRHERVTDANGTARVAWRLGPHAGDNRLRSKVERFELEFHARGRPDPASARLRIAAAKQHEGTVGELLPAPLVVQAMDARGNPLSEMMVRWGFTDGRGTVDRESASAADTVLYLRTDERGRAAVYWELGARAGSQEVVASFISQDLAPGGNGKGNGGGNDEVKFEASAKPGHLATLLVTPTPVSMSVGNTVTLSTSGVDEHGNTVEVSDASWSSSDASVASVDGTGTVTAVAPGTARIEAKRGPARGYADITVVEPERAAVTGVVASREELSFDRFGQSIAVDGTAHDDAGAVVGDAELSWSSSDPSVATVSADGLVTAVGNGSAEVVVASVCCEVSDTVTVTVDEPAVVRLDASPSAMGFSQLGGQGQIDVTLFDARDDIVSGSVGWTSGDPLVASVDGSGLVTAVSNGSTRIVVAADCCDAADTVDVVVHEPVLDYIEANPKSVDLMVGDTTQLSAVGYDTAGDTADVELTWSSTNSNVVVVDQVGTIIAKAQGMAAIVVGAACCTAADTVLVGVDEQPIAPSRVEASWEDIRFRALEETFQLEAAAFDEQERTIVDARYTWSSTDPSVASVDSMGLVTARANGLAAIVLASPCCTVADTVPVAVDQEVSLVAVEPGALTLEVGQERDLTARVEDANGYPVDDAPRTWRSTNPSAADVDRSGHVTGLNEGEATLELEASGVMGTTMATVVEPSPVTPLFADGFESGDLSHTQNGVSWASGRQTTVGQSRVHSETWSLEFTYPTALDGEDSFSEQRLVGLDGLTEVWVQYWIYIPATFEHRTQDGPSNNKFFRMFNAEDDGTFSLTYEYQAEEGGSSLRRVLSQSYTSDGASNWPTDTGGQSGFIGPDGALKPGHWHKIGIYFRSATGATVNDGRSELWVDGQLFHELDWAFWAKGDRPAWVDSLYLLGWANSGFSEETRFHIDDLRIWNVYPGWGRTR